MLIYTNALCDRDHSHRGTVCVNERYNAKLTSIWPYSAHKASCFQECHVFPTKYEKELSRCTYVCAYHRGVEGCLCEHDPCREEPLAVQIFGQTGILGHITSDHKTTAHAHTHIQHNTGSSDDKHCRFYTESQRIAAPC